MKTEAFQNLLLKSAISVMACDGSIDESEIAEIKNMADNEIYFMGYDIEEPFEKSLSYLKQNGKKAINEYLNELNQLNLNEKQELLLIEVLIRTIESDNKIEEESKSNSLITESINSEFNNNDSNKRDNSVKGI
ncbi:MAG: hypothetical protein KDE33_10995 [Bacteroidetes bacterium]|nr:hypothetical protein [Bacteroidota bacterium]